MFPFPAEDTTSFGMLVVDTCILSFFFFCFFSTFAVLPPAVSLRYNIKLSKLKH